MAKQVNPVKRTAELTPLSHDHHQGLLVAFRVKQGLNNGTDASLISKYVQWFWQNDLERHFREEEQLIVPAMPAHDPLTERMLDEHEEMEAMVHILASITDTEVLARFADLLHDHIRFEERELFPYAEQVIKAEDLHKIGEQLSKEGKGCLKWENEFWKKK